jgi:hypothetical protein
MARSATLRAKETEVSILIRERTMGSAAARGVGIRASGSESRRWNRESDHHDQCDDCLLHVSPPFGVLLERLDLASLNLNFVLARKERKDYGSRPPVTAIVARIFASSVRGRSERC